MDEKEKFEANKRNNAPFLRALNVLMKEKNLNQAEAAALLKTKSGTFSDYKSGKKKAGQEMYDRLVRAFGGRLNIRYLTGESEYMMLANVPDEEIIDYTQRDGNPDFEVMKKAKAARISTEIPSAMTSSLDRSFLIEKEIGNTKSYVDKLIESLEEQIKAQAEQLDDKQKIITMLEKRVAELEAKQQLADAQEIIRKHPFPVGVADKNDNETTRV